MKKLKCHEWNGWKNWISKWFRSKKLTLEQALEAIDSISPREGNFIGFSNKTGEVIQFIRKDIDSWYFDNPEVIDRKWTLRTRCCETVTTNTVKKIVNRFYHEQPFGDLCQLKIKKIRHVEVIDLDSPKV